MLLIQAINKIKEICALQKNVNFVSAEDVYEAMALPNIDYGAMVFNQTAYNYDIDLGLNRLSFRLFYIDRLTDDEANKLEIQSIGFEVLKEVIKGMNSLSLNPSKGLVFRPFTQKFKDMCAGAYVEMTVEFYDEWTCPDDGYAPLSYDADCEEIITALENEVLDLKFANSSLEKQIQDLYDTFQNGMIDIEFDSNGEYSAEDFGASGFRTVEVNVAGSDCQESYDEGYAEGYERGNDEGYNEGYNVGHNDGYDLGHSDGRKEGYELGYNKGYQDGIKTCGGGGSTENGKWGLTGYFNGWGTSSDIYFEPYESKALFMNESFDVQYIHNFISDGMGVKIRYNNEWNLSYTADLYNEPQIRPLTVSDMNMELSNGSWNIYLLGEYDSDGLFNPQYIVVTANPNNIENINLSLNMTLNTENKGFASVQVLNDFDESSVSFYDYPASCQFIGQYGNTLVIKGYDADGGVVEEHIVICDGITSEIIWN